MCAGKTQSGKKVRYMCYIPSCSIERKFPTTSGNVKCLTSHTDILWFYESVLFGLILSRRGR